MLGSDLLTVGEEFHGISTSLVPLILSQPIFRNDLIGGDWAVVVLLLGRGREEVALEFLVFKKVFRERVATIVAGTILVDGPERCAGGARDVASNDEFDWQHLALFGGDDIRIDHLNDMVVNNVLGVFKPPGTSQVEDLSLEGNGCEDPVEGALAVGGDK